MMEEHTNECRVRMTDYIADRERTDRCTQFTFKDGPSEKNESASVREKLDKLFQ